MVLFIFVCLWVGFGLGIAKIADRIDKKGLQSSRGDLRIVEYKNDSGTEYYRIEICDFTTSYGDPYFSVAWRELDTKRYASVSDAMDAMESHRRLEENRKHRQVIYTTKEA